MTFRVKALVCVVVAGALASLYSTLGHSSGPHSSGPHPSGPWLHFFVYLIAILLSSGMKVALPKTESTMSVNFPFILLGVLQMSPLQAVILAVSSVIAQCRFRVIKPFTLVQILFNVANVTTATVLACLTYGGCLKGMNGEVTPALAVASLVYFVATGAPVTLILAWEAHTSPLAEWRQDYLWYVPFYLVGAMLAATANFIGLLFGWMTSLLIIPMVYTVYRAYCAQMAIVRDRERHALETEALHMRTIEGLAMAVEAKDMNTHRHLMRVRVYVSELGKIMGLDKPIMQALTTAAFLHDIGKLAVPEHIINKPGKLTPEEFEKMKIHPVVGADILERVHFPYPVVPIVRSHHEAWDGSGYPDGLKGEEIPIGARILTAVDCLDALASERPYRRAMPLDEAMAFVKRGAAIKFDPEVVRLLEEHYQELEEMARQQIEEMEPLKTDLFIQRGEAPGNGFEPEQSAAQQAVSARDGAEAQAARPLDLIVAASQEAKAVFELSQVLGTSLSVGEACAMIARRLQPLIPFDCFAVYLRQNDLLNLRYVGGRAADAFSRQPIAVGQGLSGWVANSGRPIVNGNPTVEPNYLASSRLFTENSSALAVPLFHLSGAILGSLAIYARGSAAFSRDHLRILEATEPGFSLALENTLRSQPVETESGLDPLTQLPKLPQFFARVESEIEKALAAHQSFGVAVCDLNSFKAVNGRHGSLVGDALLRALAREFRLSFGAPDSIARTGGDEFAFLFPGMNALPADGRLEALEEVLRKVCAELQIEIDLSLCAGVSLYPADGSSVEELLGAAERRVALRKRKFSEDRRNSEPHPTLEGSLTV
jgi:diguanylate cyclase (GGDEF)-like protein/putative nucleotidyltransferase with HDIG domain